ncbi:hypothetical protein [Luteibacter sp.]|uniref:hypothetical protein n=1 Tax=Luteibacter sp. TaxID=1886636 RepID=UPI003F7D0E89
MSMPQSRLAAVPAYAPAPRGLAIGDMRGHGRVTEDAALAWLALDRRAGLLRSSHPERALLSVQMDGEVEWVSAYVPGTNVLETVGHADGAELRVVDFMAVAEGRADQAEAVAAGRFVRIITCTEGEASFRLVCAAPLASAGKCEAQAADGWHLACSRPLGAGAEVVATHVRLAAGESVAFVISEAPVQGGPALTAEALHALGETIHYWTWWSDRCRYKGEDFDQRLREALALKLSFCEDAYLAEVPGMAGFTPAPSGDVIRAAASFLALGYRGECAALLSRLHGEQAPEASRPERWSAEESFRATLDAYVLRYGTLGLPGDVSAAIAAQQAIVQCTKCMA